MYRKPVAGFFTACFLLLTACGGGGSVSFTDGGRDGSFGQDGGGDAPAGDAGKTADGGRGTVSVGGSVSGLVGTGLVVANDGGDDLAVSANGTFTFSSKLPAGAHYAVRVKKEPTNPSETCVVSQGSGAIGASAVTNVKVTCATTAFTVGGTVTGLIPSDATAANGLVLQDNGEDALTVARDGTFTFTTPVASGSTFNVTVETEPTAPAQACVVNGGQGTVANGDVTSVVVNCEPRTYALGGTISGLVGSVTLADGAGSTLIATANGAFAFPTPVESGATYAVTVTGQPTSPFQQCAVAGGAGTVTDVNVTTISVECTTEAFVVGGSLTGLAATESVVLQDNGGDTLTVSANGPFAFATPVRSGSAYAITVLTSPGSPAETCIVASGTGTIAGTNVANATVTCTTNTYNVGGTLVGLAANDVVVLEDNGGDNLTLTANGAFTFASPIASGSQYAVSVSSAPESPVQTCTVTGGTGSIGAAKVTSVTVNCATTSYAVGGSVTGILGVVVLEDNGGDDLSVTADGSFAFATPVASGAGYAVTVKTQPGAPAQTCVVATGSGVVTSAPVTGVSVACTTNAYRVSATVSGLAAGEQVVLADNGSDWQTVSGNGAVTFPVSVLSGQPYDVTVSNDPSAPVTQSCVVANGSGVAGAGNVTGITVTCTTNLYSVSGVLTGLGAGDTLVLEDNGHDGLTLTTNGPFTFSTSVASGSSYLVTVASQPGSPVFQTCSVTSGSGPVTGSNVVDVAVACTTNAYPVGGTLTGLAAGESIVLQDDGADNLTLAGNGPFTFVTPVASAQSFQVSVLTNPGSPEYETCIVTGGEGTIGGASVSSVTVNCSPNVYTVGGTINGLVGMVVLENSGGPGLALTANGTFAFPASVASDQPYDVTVQTDPTSPVQVCTVTGGSGIVGSANVVSVQIACATTTYSVGGTLSGLATGDSVTLLDNGGSSLARSTNGAFTFTVAVASGSPYTVTVQTSPSSPISQQCSVTPGTGGGSVTNANVTSVAVTCSTSRYTVGGTLSGLAAGDSVALLDNGADALARSADGTFTFATAVASGNPYAVTVKAQPSTPVQVCAVSLGTGTMGNGNITNVAVTCTTSGGAEGAACTLDSDCSAGYCSVLTSTCVAGQSCKAAQVSTTLGVDHAGIDSCGTGESTDPSADQAHESCCRSLLLPTGTDATAMRMDKYEVTTGRVRQFVESINALEGGYNLRAWAQNQVSTGTATGVRLSQQMSAEVIGFLPTSNDPSTSLNLPAQLGATSMDANVPSEYQGCFMADGAYGAGDYWQPASTLSGFDSPARSFAQSDYDIKSMNCGTYWLYASFCAWDGGRLPTLAEVEAVWGPGQYPWTAATGASAPFWPSPYPYTTVTAMGETHYYADIPQPSVAHTVNWNNNSFNADPGNFYFFPNLGSLDHEPSEVDNGTDLTPYIASPGRFALDVTTTKSSSFAGTEGWQDLAANLLEMTLEGSMTGGKTFCDCATYTSAEQASLPACTCPSPGATPDTKPGVVRSTDLPTSPWVGGSWEGHESANPADPPYFSVHAYDEGLQAQYGKTGFRCVRPAP